MAKFVAIGHYCDDVLEKRAPYREAHLAGLQAQKEQGILITIGPTKDLTLFVAIYEAESQEAVETLITGDPYWQNGVWTDYDIKEWIQAIG